MRYLISIIIMLAACVDQSTTQDDITAPEQSQLTPCPATLPASGIATCTGEDGDGVVLGVCAMSTASIVCILPCAQACAEPGEPLDITHGNNGEPLCYCGSPFQP
jgi:hypothetical protein